MSRFPLAPMSGLVRGLTFALLAAPALFIVTALLGGAPARALVVVGAFLVTVYAAVWLVGRPSAFELSGDGLVVRFPLRRVRVARGDLAGARLLDRGAVCERYGLSLRVGVGGLWGGFGWLWTRRRGLVEMYVSRTDGAVLVERRSGRDLLITPERPDEFLRAVQAGAKTVGGGLDGPLRGLPQDRLRRQSRRSSGG